MILLFILFMMVILFCYFQIYKIEKYDNMIPNKLRWKLYKANNKDDFRHGWCQCKKLCKRTGISYLGCIKSCEDIINDRSFYLRNNNYNQFINS